MAVRLVCRACGKRLKFPDGVALTRSAKCPKCLTPVDPTAVLEASAYRPAGTARDPAPPDREDDPLPYPVPATGGLHPPLARSAPPKPSLPPPAPKVPSPAPSAPLSPVPVPSGGVRPALARANETFSLDEDTGGAEPEPFRVPVHVLADSLRQVAGACFAVLVPHGLFLEHEPMKPFLYVPVGCPVEARAAGELAVTLPDRRAVTLRFEPPPFARDVAAFLAGTRPAPVAGDYARRRRVLPIMAGVCALVTGLFVLVAVAYLVGWPQAAEEAKPDPSATALAPVPVAPESPEPVPPDPLVSHLDRAKKHASSALEPGPADVTALALAPDGNHLGIGYADGTTHVWPLDQQAFRPYLPGPKADGPVSRVQFDTKSNFVFAHGPAGAVAASMFAPTPITAKFPGAPVAVASEPEGDRFRVAAVRGTTLQLRLVAASFIQNPPKGKDKLYALPGKGDETTPAGLGKDPAKPLAATFFAWAPGDRLLAGQPDGSVLVWSGALKPEAASRDHKGPVKTWAACPATGDFATGDEQGNVGIWSAAGGLPVVRAVLVAPVSGLSFNATGSRLLVSDGSDWLVIWDVATAKTVHRVKRPAAIKAVAYGPTDDVILVAAGKTVEVWWLPELLK